MNLRSEKAQLIIRAIALVSIVATIVFSTMQRKTVEILFPINFLKDGQNLLDPDNTESIWEYYLLENLSCGLIKDSKTSATGYEGCLAEEFYQEDDKTWLFKIRNLEWSDGTAVLPEEIENWIFDLQKSKKRHIRFLKLSDRINYDALNRILRVHFPFKMDTTLLHELSLADSGLMPPNYRKFGWTKTIGAYSVKEWNKTENRLILQANQYSHLFRTEMPETARLWRVLDPSQRPKLFKEISVDVVPINSYISPVAARTVVANAPQMFVSRPISIAYFHFNHDNIDARDFGNRAAFAKVISALRSNILKVKPSELEWEPESQMVPNGFSGRVDDYKIENIEMKASLKKLVIRLPTVFQEYNKFIEKIKNQFYENHITLSIHFSDESNFEKSDFAGLYIFLGNQLDSSGSWAFLTSDVSGNLSKWKNQYRSEYESVFSSVNIELRQEKLKVLHKTMLEKVLAVPLIVGKQRYLFSDRIDFSKWNTFDSRLRIYDLSWK